MEEENFLNFHKNFHSYLIRITIGIEWNFRSKNVAKDTKGSARSRWWWYDVVGDVKILEIRRCFFDKARNCPEVFMVMRKRISEFHCFSSSYFVVINTTCTVIGRFSGIRHPVHGTVPHPPPGRSRVLPRRLCVWSKRRECNKGVRRHSECGPRRTYCDSAVVPHVYFLWQPPVSMMTRRL